MVSVYRAEVHLTVLTPCHSTLFKTGSPFLGVNKASWHSGTSGDSCLCLPFVYNPVPGLQTIVSAFYVGSAESKPQDSACTQ